MGSQGEEPQVNRNDQCHRCGKYLYGPAEANLRAENNRLREAFYHAWSLRQMLGAKWDGESDPLELTFQDMEGAG